MRGVKRDLEGFAGPGLHGPRITLEGSSPAPDVSFYR